MKDVVEIKIGLENCEAIELPVALVGELAIDNIKSYTRRIANNCITRFDAAEKIAIEIFSEADKKYETYGGQSEHTVFKRLTKYRDITDITLIYDDGTNNVIQARWKDTDEYECENKYQKNYISSAGNLYILIGKKIKLEDYFDRDEIEDAQTMEFNKSVIEAELNGDECNNNSNCCSC